MLTDAETLSDAWTKLEGKRVKTVSVTGWFGVEFTVKDARDEFLIVEFDRVEAVPFTGGVRVTYEGILPYNSDKESSDTSFYFPE